MKIVILTIVLSVCFISPASSYNIGERSSEKAGKEIKIPDPPKEHPRLYIRESEVSSLRKKIEHPQGKKIINALAKAGVDRSPEEEASERDRGFRYYAKMRGVTSRAQLHALNYLVDDDRKEGRTAVEEMLDTLRKTNFGVKNDLSRASGSMLMVGAIVYDWCYELMTSEEKSAYIKEFIRIAGTMECGYPPKRNEAIAGHSSEWMIMRDMLSCGIAIYDEYPDMYNYIREMLAQDYIPVRNFIYKGKNYHQGTSYVNVRFANDLFCTWILSKLGAKSLFVPEQQYVMYDFIYRRRPDGLVLPSGDENHIRSGWKSYALPNMLASSYYGDSYLAYEFERKQGLEPHCLIFALLWRDFELKATPPDDLPLSMYSGTPFGWMLARTSWGEDSVIAEMKINENFVGNHQHLDGGSFQIYYKGPLALDSGLYQGTGGGYNSANNKNYTKRTIAHNSILVYDPDEVFETYNYGGEDRTATAANDGGQRMPGKGWDTCRSFEELLGEEYTVGKVISHAFGPSSQKPEYTYLKGDITKAYSAKVKDVKRSFVFFNLKNTKVPAAMVIFDHVVSSNPDFRKFWLLHSIEEPEISDNSFTVRRTLDGDSGMLKCDILLPDNHNVEKIGGKGREFWVFGTNYESYPTMNRPDIAKEYGQWRVEVSPSKAGTEDCFLNVIQIADNDCRDLHKVSMLRGNIVTGAQIADRAVFFSRNGEIISEGFDFETDRKLSILVTDLKPGKWTVRTGAKVIRKITVKSEESSCYITLDAGKYYFSL